MCIDGSMSIGTPDNDFNKERSRKLSFEIYRRCEVADSKDR